MRRLTTILEGICNVYENTSRKYETDVLHFPDMMGDIEDPPAGTVGSNTEPRREGTRLYEDNLLSIELADAAGL